MPHRPPLFRSANQIASAAASRVAYDRRRLAESETRKLYKTTRWYAVRDRQLNAHPLCVICEAQDLVTAATICDHVTPHRGDPFAFWAGPFQSLCASCRSSAKQREELAAILAPPAAA